MTFGFTAHGHHSRPTSSKIRHLRQAAAEARADAEVVIRKQSRRASAGSTRLSHERPGGQPRRSCGTWRALLLAHPVSTLLIAGVVAGTIWYHQSPRLRE